MGERRRDVALNCCGRASLDGEKNIDYLLTAYKMVLACREVYFPSVSEADINFLRFQFLLSTFWLKWESKWYRKLTPSYVLFGSNSGSKPDDICSLNANTEEADDVSVNATTAQEGNAILEWTWKISWNSKPDKTAPISVSSVRNIICERPNYGGHSVSLVCLLLSREWRLRWLPFSVRIGSTEKVRSVFLDCCRFVVLLLLFLFLLFYFALLLTEKLLRRCWKIIKKIVKEATFALKIVRHTSLLGCWVVSL